jgi:hypothetical protein
MVISKTEYKITTKIEGTCPHCNKSINIENVELFEDKSPTQEYYDKRAEALNHADETYEKFLIENPVNPIIHDLYKSWKDRIESLQIRSSIRSETIYLYKGDCPYCNKNIELRSMMCSTLNGPPRLRDQLEEQKTLGEWLRLLEQEDTAKMHDPTHKSHFLEHCPSCDQIIHLVDGKFFSKSTCPVDTIDLKSATAIKVV